ncbi:uncharacterized protein [Nicotiana tomentosiformis]|uniref:uncharacterized protein n=1 Tax=Nicotiana tomentosiformis TaxID=4098 RepID=UPI00388C9305
MAQNRPMGADQFGNIAFGAGRQLGDYARPVYNQVLSSVKPPTVAANNFELKQGLLQTLQNSCAFREKMNEDPNNYLMDFEEIMNTFQYNGVSQDAVYLRAFPFTLKDNSKHWLRSLPHGSIRIWEKMTKKILTKYFSSAKTGKFRKEIHNFYQNETETVFEAWERFKEIVQLDAMTKEIRKVTLASIYNEPHAACDICGRGHPTHECQASMEEVNVVANAWQQNNSRFQGPPGFGNQPRPQFQPQQPIQYGLEDLMKSFIVKTDERLDAYGAAIKELGTDLHNLERQMG